MTNRFVWSGATGANDGTTWEDAYATLMQDWGAEGHTPGTDKVYVRSSHSEISASTLTLLGSTADSTTLPVDIRCVVGADTGTTPGNLATGAKVATNNASADIIISEGVYIYGVTFESNDIMELGASSASDNDVMLEDCLLTLIASSNYIMLGVADYEGTRVHLLNTDIDMGSALNNKFRFRECLFVWEGGTWISNQSVPVVADAPNGRGHSLTFRNVDFSAQSSSFLVNAAGFFQHTQVLFSRCLLNASVGHVTGTHAKVGNNITFIHCQDGTDSDPAYQLAAYTPRGSVTAVTAIYRAGGAKDGVRTNPIAWTLDTTYGTRRTYPGHALESPPIIALLPGDGATEYTVRGYFASGGTQQNDDVWIDLIRVNDGATNSLGVRDTTRVSPETAATNHPTDSLSSWVGSDVGTKQYTEKAFTPDKPGAISVQFLMTSDAGAAGQIHADPLLEVRDSNGNILVRRAWIDPRTGGQIMEFTSPRAQLQLGVM